MKIMIDARSLGNKPSGVGMYIYNFAIALAGIQDIQLVMLTDVSHSTEMVTLSQMENVEVHILGKEMHKNFELTQYFKFVQQQIHEEKPDIFWEGNNMFPVKLTNPYGKMVVTIYDVFPITFPECYGKVYPHYFKYGIRNTLKYVDAIIYDSNDAKQEMEKYFSQAKEKKSYVGYVIVEQLPEKEITNQNYYFYVGNLESRKGTDILLQGYEKYLELGGEKDLYIAGSVREDDIQKQLDAIMQRTNKIHYLGYISLEEKAKLYAECSAFLFPSRAEGFGIPCVEAAQYHKPVITSNLAVFDEVLGKYGKRFSLGGDASVAAQNMARAMMECEKETVQNGLTLPREYSADALADGMVEFLENLQ